MAYRTGIALGHPVRDRAAGCNGAARNARPTMIAVTRVAPGVGVGGAGLEAAYAVTASPARHGVKGVKSSATKPASGMKATAPAETPAPMETAATTMEATTMEAAATTMEAAAAPATARLGYVRERQPHDCACEDPSERQPDQLAVDSSQHIFPPP
jgi:hypothetical protein